MRSKLAVAAGGLALAAALGIPVGAQAAVTPSGAANASAAGITPDASTTCNSNGAIYDVGNGEYLSGGVTGNGTNAIFFVPATEVDSPQYCAVNYGGNEYNIQQKGLDECVSVNTSAHIVGFESACGYAWDKWEPTRVGTYHNQAVYTLKNAYNGQCLYDQYGYPNPATYTDHGCSASDRFEQFVFDSLP